MHLLKNINFLYFIIEFYFLKRLISYEIIFYLFSLKRLKTINTLNIFNMKLLI